MGDLARLQGLLLAALPPPAQKQLDKVVDEELALLAAPRLHTARRERRCAPFIRQHRHALDVSLLFCAPAIATARHRHDPQRPVSVPIAIQTVDDVSAELAALRAQDPRVGAVCCFVGTVRDRHGTSAPAPGAAVASLELEHYPGATEKPSPPWSRRPASALPFWARASSTAWACWRRWSRSCWWR